MTLELTGELHRKLPSGEVIWKGDRPTQLRAIGVLSQSLVSLDLSRNDVGTSVRYLVDGLKTRTALQELNVSGCSLDRQGAVILAVALKDSQSIVSINFLENNLNESDANEIIELLAARLDSGRSAAQT